ncbi:MAG: RNA polymerase sigma factor [Rhodanobacteraceae bacterium]
MPRLMRGDRTAFEQLVQCYERPMFNVAYRMLGNATEAADATQNVFLKVFEHLRGYNPKYRLFSWIYRIAVNESIDRLEQRKRTAASTDPVDDLTFAGSERGPDELVGNQQMHDLIQASLMSLQDEYRAVIVLRHFSECSYRQMAEILDIPEKTVKSRLHTARMLLREKLCTQGVKTA